MKQVCRDYDCVGRMGGDEFVIVAPGVTVSTTNEMIRRIEAIAGEVGRKICREEIVSVSVGHASFPSDGETGEELLAEADRRMYRVKQEHHRKIAAGRASS